jgi:hypothetical protein
MFLKLFDDILQNLLVLCCVVLCCIVLCCPLAVPVYGAGVFAYLTAIADHKKMY